MKLRVLCVLYCYINEADLKHSELLSTQHTTSDIRHMDYWIIGLLDIQYTMKQ